jgi:hypothetical protein
VGKLLGFDFSVEYKPGTTNVVADALSRRDTEEGDLLALSVPRFNLIDRLRHVAYKVGDWALLRLRQRAASSLPQGVHGKLKSRFFGPYHVTELINEVAVRLALPPRARIHDVFHVGLLKKLQGTPPADPPALPPLHHGAVVPELARVVRYRLARGVRQVLVEWKGESAASATWEDVEPFCAKYPAFQLEDELVLEVERDAMIRRTYSRQRRARDVRCDQERSGRCC